MVRVSAAPEPALSSPREIAEEKRPSRLPKGDPPYRGPAKEAPDAQEPPPTREPGEPATDWPEEPDGTPRDPDDPVTSER